MSSKAEMRDEMRAAYDRPEYHPGACGCPGCAIEAPIRAGAGAAVVCGVCGAPTERNWLWVSYRACVGCLIRALRESREQEIGQ